jgi:hypothetical protein
VRFLSTFIESPAGETGRAPTVSSKQSQSKCTTWNKDGFLVRLHSAINAPNTPNCDSAMWRYIKGDHFVNEDSFHDRARVKLTPANMSASGRRPSARNKNMHLRNRRALGGVYSEHQGEVGQQTIRTVQHNQIRRVAGSGLGGSTHKQGSGRIS